MAALWPAARAANSHFVEQHYENSAFELLRQDAVRQAGDDPLVLLVGTSQTRRSLDPDAVGAALADAGQPGLVYNLGMDGTHVAAFPFFLRRALDRGTVSAVVLELGWISHDQYQGVRFVRQWVEDETVLDAFESTRAGSLYVELNRKERWFPPLATGRRARGAFDSLKRRAETAAEFTSRSAARGWTPHTTRKDREALVSELTEKFATYPDFVQDAFIGDAFVAAAKACQALCAERRVPLIVYLPPFNRELAPRVPILRHYEQSVREDLIPRLERAGIPVIVPPDRFHADPLFSDHVHLHRSATTDFSRWFGERLGEHLAGE